MKCIFFQRSEFEIMDEKWKMYSMKYNYQHKFCISRIVFMAWKLKTRIYHLKFEQGNRITIIILLLNSKNDNFNVFKIIYV